MKINPINPRVRPKCLVSQWKEMMAECTETPKPKVEGWSISDEDRWAVLVEKPQQDRQV